MWSSYVAIGDSFTEGMNDYRPDGSLRGWADLVAQALADGNPEFRYANLAVRGKLVQQVAAEQVPVAVQMRPALVSLSAGVNDVLRPKVNLSDVIARFDRSVRDLTEAGSEVVVFVGGGSTRAVGSSGRGRISARIASLNEAIAQSAARYGCHVVDVGVPQVFRHPDVWSVDRLHLSSIGHERIAGAVCEALGVPFGGAHAGDWRMPLPPATPTPWLTARREDLYWFGKFALPWAGRRLRGRSSGDGRSPKRPELSAI